MNILMKNISMWLLILWYKANWVLCADNGPESYNLLPENDNTKKPPNNDLDELFLHANSTDKLLKNTGRIKFEGNSTLITENNRPLENSTNKLLNNTGRIKFEGVNSTLITEKNRPVENIVNMEGGGSVIPVHPNSPQGLRSREHVASFSSKDLPVNIQSNPPPSSEKPKIFPRKGVNESTENSSSMENSDEISIEKEVDVPLKICFCCPNNTLRNESDINCSKCCDSVKDVGNTSSTANNISNTTPLGNPLPTESIPPAVINVTVHDSINQDTSNFTNQDKHNSTANSTAPSMVPPKRNKKPQFTLDASNDSPANLSSQPLSHNDSNKTDYVIPVVGAILAVPLAIVLAMFLYKKGSEFWERRHYRRMDFLIDGMYND